MDRQTLDNRIRDFFADKNWPDRYDPSRDKLQSEDIADLCWKLVNEDNQENLPPVYSTKEVQETLTLVSVVTSQLKEKLSNLNVQMRAVETQFCAYRMTQNKWQAQMEAELFAIGRKKKVK